MRRSFLISIVILVIAQACCCVNLLGGPRPSSTVTPSDQAIEQLKERLKGILGGSPDGSVSMTITEEELTSLVVKLLEKQADLPEVSNLQILLRNGRIEAYATLRVNAVLSVPGMAAFSIAVVDGRLEVALEEIDFGPLNVPQQTTEAMTTRLNQLIAESVENELGVVTITGVEIGDGEMTITAQLAAPQ